MEKSNIEKQLVLHAGLTHSAWVGLNSGLVLLDCEWFDRSTGASPKLERLGEAITCLWCTVGRWQP